MITRTDDADAFGQEGIFKLNVKVQEGHTVSKAILLINDGDIEIEYIEPTFPIPVVLNSQQTSFLKDYNHCDLILFDGFNKQHTIHCVADFSSREAAGKKEG